MNKYEKKKRANVSISLSPPLLSITTIHFFSHHAIHDFRLKALCSSPACLLALSSSPFLAKCYYYSMMTDRFAMYTRLVIHRSSNLNSRSSHRPLLSTFSHLIDIAVFLFFFSFVQQCTFVRIPYSESSSLYFLYTYNRKDVAFSIDTCIHA